MDTRTARILVVTDKAEPDEGLVQLMSHRAGTNEVQFRVVVPNPARSELHLLHPERHDKADEAEQVLHKAMPALEMAAGGRVIGSGSRRPARMAATGESPSREPIDEIVLAVAPHGLSARFHQDLPHRLKHFGIPV